MKTDTFNFTTDVSEHIAEKTSLFSDKKIIDQVVRLDEECFPFPWSRKDWSDAAKSDGHLLFAAVVGGNVACFALFHFNKWDDTSHLYKIIVKPKYRRQEFGIKLMGKAEIALRTLGVKSVYLEVSNNNIAGQALYKHLGFETFCI